MPNPIDNALLFLVQILFEFYILVLMLRLILQFQYADYYNPIVQLIIRLTNPVVKPLQRILPSIRGIDTAIVVLILLLELVKVTFIAWMIGTGMPNHLGTLTWAIGAIGNRLINIFFFAILIRAIISWLNPNPGSALMVLLYHLTEPLLRPARRLIKPISGFDFSPIVAMIVIKLVGILLFWPLIEYGTRLALS